jgi:hypothetical protein
MAQSSVRGACGFVLVGNPEVMRFWTSWSLDEDGIYGNFA